MSSRSMVPVTTPGGSYSVQLGLGILDRVGEEISRLGFQLRVAVIADETVARLHGSVLRESLERAGMEVLLLMVPPGETSKDLKQVIPLLSELARHKLERRSPVIAFGGGVVGDLAGFVAASYLRGVPFIQIPTTLLAMVDSSVGGKTGVNLPEGKNLVGAFYQPALVMADLSLLETLAPRERSAGMAEVIKHGIIADLKLFRSVEKGWPSDMVEVIRRSVEIKAAVVGEDERETTGRRALLNFGHTLGHAIENAAGYGTYLHGEAVAIGLRAAAHLSVRLMGMPTEEVRKIEKAIEAHRLPLVSSGVAKERVREALKTDKKVASGINRWVLSPRIGTAEVCDKVPADAVEEVIELCVN